MTTPEALREEDHRSTLQELQQVLAETRDLFYRVRDTEEKLQGHIVRGEAQEIADLEPFRQELEQEMLRLQEKRRQLLPRDYTARSFIREHASPGARNTILALLDEINGLAYQLRNHQEVNRSLLQERLRHVQEMRELLLPQDKTYDPYGQVHQRESYTNFNLNRGC